MILPPFFGHKTPSNDGEPYRIHYSYLGEDAFTYNDYPKSVNKHTYIGADVVTYKVKYLPPLIIHTYLSEDTFTYKKPTKSLVLTYTALDCLTYTRRYPPSYPLNILASSLDSSSYLTWTPPDQTNLPVTDYIIQYSLANPYSIMTENDHILRAENGEPITLENAETFNENWILFKDKRNSQNYVMITGLINNNTYSFKVLAVNAAGRSDFAYSNNVTPQV